MQTSRIGLAAFFTDRDPSTALSVALRTTASLRMTSHKSSDIGFYLLAAAAGIGTGVADLMIDDLLFTALLVLASCMLLGTLAPRWPWRWVLAVGGFVPLTELAAFLIRTVKPTRAQVFGSFLAFLPGIAGAYGGSLMRGVIDNLWERK